MIHHVAGMVSADKELRFVLSGALQARQAI